MAHRDRSQGFAFVYVDVAEFLKEQKELFEKNKHLDEPLQGPNVVNFNKDPMPAAAPAPAPAKKTPAAEAKPSVDAIKDNLDRLQTLHHKLHAMLEEMSKISDWKKKKK